MGGPNVVDDVLKNLDRLGQLQGVVALLLERLVQLADNEVFERTRRRHVIERLAVLVEHVGQRRQQDVVVLIGHLDQFDDVHRSLCP